MKKMRRDLIDEIMDLFDIVIDISTPDNIDYEIDKKMYREKLENLFKEQDKI